MSCVTASGVLEAIDRARYDVVAVGITPSGQWVPASTDPDDWRLRDGVMPHVADSKSTVLLPRSAQDRAWRVASGDSIEHWADVDVAFPVLHGPWGEDGTIQGALELVDVRYVGAGVLASAVGMDKQFMKSAFVAAGLPVTPDVVIRPGQGVDEHRHQIERLGLPVFVKPARAGSSMGISKVESWDQLDTAVADAAAHDPKVIVEAAVVGREIETAVLVDGEDIRVSPAGEIVTGGDYAFYDYQAKYFDEAHVELRCPTELDPAVAAVVADYASRAFVAVGAESLARVDCFVTEAGDVVVNEINTMPGFTPTSMYPRMWDAGGVDYPALVDTLIRTALHRPVGLR